MEEVVTVDCIGRNSVSEEVTFKLSPYIDHVLAPVILMLLHLHKCLCEKHLVLENPMRGLSHLALASCFLLTLLLGCSPTLERGHVFKYKPTDPEPIPLNSSSMTLTLWATILLS